jgi:tripartite-type tricarboxylate transporter receptor subunit TctC
MLAWTARAVASLILSAFVCAGAGQTWSGKAWAQGRDAQDPASFYKSHTVRFLAGGGPGGGYDNYARLLAPHLAAALGTAVIVENQPAAGGLVALNRLYAGENDGLQFIIMNGGGAVMSQLFGLSTVQYDLAKVNFLATVSSSPWVVLVDDKSPIRSMADLKKGGAMVRWPATGPIDGLSDGASMVCEAYDINCRVVLGYKSSNEGSLALMRGEMDALYVSDTSANNYIKSGQNRGIAVIARERTRFLPDMPTVFEQGGLSPTQEWWLSARADVDALGRIVIAGPNIPPDRLAFLQEAFRKVLTDPAIRAEGDRQERYIDFQDGETTRKRALGVINGVTGDRKALLKDVVMRKYLPGAN